MWREANMQNNRFWAAVSRVLEVMTVTLIAALILAPGALAAAKYKVLYRFTGGADGGFLDAGVILDSSGNLYGTAYIGGAYGNGAVFELTPNSDGSWTETVLYSFMGGTDGSNPLATLIADAAGNLYSTTDWGGAYGLGTVFMLTPNSDGSWTETVLYSFAGGTDGSLPVAGLIFDAAGNFYGTTNHGGRGGCHYLSGSGCGTVFKLTHNSDGTWTESVLYAFAGGKDGGVPDHSNLVFDAAGDLYGGTRNEGLYGCDYGCGTLFELIPNSDGTWSEKVLHRFKQRTDGGSPQGTPIFDSFGNLYGTTLVGGHHDRGLVFKLTTGSGGNWTERVIHEFTGGKDGGNPYAGVVFDASGNLYGATEGGGSHGHGIVYKLTSGSGGGWKETVLHTFKGGKDGENPRGDVLFDANGNLYDTTTGNGRKGTVFEITP
jgi:uncharacterized repeat protein (TIGR03803 family)